jgi:hypothetical protein
MIKYVKDMVAHCHPARGFFSGIKMLSVVFLKSSALFNVCVAGIDILPFYSQNSYHVNLKAFSLNRVG